MMNFYCSEKEDKTNRFDSEVGTRLRTNQNKTMAKPQTTLNTAKVTQMTRKRREGIRQPLTKTSKSEEDRAVHEDVTKGPCTSTFVLINITPRTIEAAFVEIKCGPSIREVTKETTSVRFQTTVSAADGAKGTKGVTHTEVRTKVLGILGFDVSREAEKGARVCQAE